MFKKIRSLLSSNPNPPKAPQKVKDQSTSDLETTIKGLPSECQIDLFYEASQHNNIGALNTLLTVGNISSKALTEVFYDACTYDRQDIAKVLIQDPRTDVNWVNPHNFDLTPAVRAAMNDHDVILEMVLGRSDFDPNKLYSPDSPVPRTLITYAFGYTPKDDIPTPDKPWKERLLNDPRVDWDAHASFIPLAEEFRRQSAINQANFEKAHEQRMLLEAQMNRTRQALDIPFPQG